MDSDQIYWKKGTQLLRNLIFVVELLIVLMFYYFSVFEKDPCLEEELLFISAV